MKKSWRILLASLVVTLGLLVPLTIVSAQSCVDNPHSASCEDIINRDDLCTRHPDATLCKDNTPQDINSNSIFGPNGVLTKAAQIIALIVGVASVVVIIISGIQYAISSGDPARLNRAKDTLIYALIGLVIAMSAQAIIVFILRRIG